MKVSYNWLQKFFDKELPPAKDVADLLTMYAFEVESVAENAGGAKKDCVLDIKILPNRAHDCLSHRGIAREIGTLLGQKIIEESPKDFDTKFSNSALEIKIEDSALCARYTSAILRNVKVGPSPQWLVELLGSIGQKSINNIVDSANCVMFSLGQPLHAFDLDKLIERDGGYSILVRGSKEGERVAPLGYTSIASNFTDNPVIYELPVGTLVITDKNCKDNKILGIAGIKGGKHAEVTGETKNILLESANFDSAKIREAAKRLGLRTDASVRFENGLALELTLEALQWLCSLITQIAGGEVDVLVDVGGGVHDVKTIELGISDVEKVLGFKIESGKIVEILQKIGCTVEESSKGENITLVVTTPVFRLDLKIKEDLIEEIGRIYGYLNVEPKKPNAKSGAQAGAEIAPSKSVVFTDAIRSILVDHGFSEVYTYTFRNTGERELENPIASDKKYLRTNLAEGLAESLKLNLHNAPLFGANDFIKIFEIGKVFDSKSESLHLGVAVAPIQKIKNSDKVVSAVLDGARAKIEEELEVKLTGKIYEGNVLEIDIENLTAKNLIVKKAHDTPDDATDLSAKQIRFKKISAYPFILRDIAVFVPKDVPAEDVFAVIGAEAGELLVQSSLFDTFTKKSEDGSEKTSYAYKLVFQSQEKTLSDEEINKIMDSVTKKLNSNEGWRVR